MTTPGVGTYVRTLRYLKWRQLFGRLWFRYCVPRAPRGTPEEICPVRPTWVVPARRLASFEPPQRLRHLIIFTILLKVHLNLMILFLQKCWV